VFVCIIIKGLNFKLMPPPRRKYLFSKVLKRQYPFLTSDKTYVNKMTRTSCKSFFSVLHGGRNDTEQHIHGNRYKESLAAKASTK
jgi:hypothetical protein